MSKLVQTYKKRRSKSFYHEHFFSNWLPIYRTTLSLILVLCQWECPSRFFLQKKIIIKYSNIYCQQYNILTAPNFSPWRRLALIGQKRTFSKIWSRHPLEGTSQTNDIFQAILDSSWVGLVVAIHVVLKIYTILNNRLTVAHQVPVSTLTESTLAHILSSWKLNMKLLKEQKIFSRQALYL